LLDFLKDGVRASKKHHLLPMGRLFELDERMSRPLRPRLKRPFQKSFPHINGLYLLLRATWLAAPAARGKPGAQLVLDPAMLAQWRQLNATERYFNLLEAWWRRASFAVSGLPGRRWQHDAGSYARDLWLQIERSDLGILVPDRRTYFLYSPEGACTLALYELFGLLDVERQAPAGAGTWWPYGASRLATI
jgi:hypothetical protein